MRQKKCFGMSLDEVIKWKDKLPTYDESQCDWNAPADKILVAPCDEQTELIQAVSKSDENTHHKAKPNIKILDILKFMEYFANLRSLFKKKLHRNSVWYMDCWRKIWNHFFFWKEKQSASQTTLTDYFDFKWIFVVPKMVVI